MDQRTLGQQIKGKGTLGFKDDSKEGKYRRPSLKHFALPLHLFRMNQKVPSQSFFSLSHRRHHPTYNHTFDALWQPNNRQQLRQQQLLQSQVA